MPDEWKNYCIFFLNSVLSGARLGIIISMYLSGYLAYNIGWSSIFYVFGMYKIEWIENQSRLQ